MYFLVKLDKTSIFFTIIMGKNTPPIFVSFGGTLLCAFPSIDKNSLQHKKNLLLYRITAHIGGEFGTSNHLVLSEIASIIRIYSLAKKHSIMLLC